MAAKRKRGLSKGLDALLSSNESYQRHQEEVSRQNEGEATGEPDQRPRDGELRPLLGDRHQRPARTVRQTAVESRYRPDIRQR